MKTFGLTGGIGTGKSSVAALLRTQHGVPVIDADQVARDVVAKGSEGLDQIVAAFGADVLDADGHLDRATMRDRIMTDPEARATLEGITHPRIFMSITDKLQAHEAEGTPVVGVEAALMVETGSYQLYDEVVVVTCEPATQVARVIARDGVTAEQAEAVLAVQKPMADKIAVATHVVYNDDGLDELEAAVAELVVDLKG